jgi:uncharacterized protein
MILVCRGHIPIRSCVVCGERKPKEILLRIGLDPETRCIVADPNRCLAGRGAYVCPHCLPQLRLTKRVRKAFRDKAEELWREKPCG